MANLLNYKFEIYPTHPQRQQLNRVLREGRLQWNRAVTIRRKLKRALITGQFDYAIETCLSSEKNNQQGVRRTAIEKFQASRPEFVSLDFELAARLYDINNLVGKTLQVEEKHQDVTLLAKELKEKHVAELTARKKAKAEDGDIKNLPKLTVYWRMMGAIDRYAGFEAKKYVDKSFESPKGMALSTVRFNISGSANSIRWNQSVQPKKGQRTYGATGEPQYKKRGEGFAYQIQNAQLNDLIHKKDGKPGHQLLIKALPEGMRQVVIAYHRPIPDDAKIKQLTVNSRSGRYFGVLSAEVPDSAWRIAPMEAGWRAGIDPGAETALTVALHNSESGELRHIAIHYGFLEKSRDRLEKMQQALALKQGPMRNRTGEEVRDALEQYSSKSAVKKLPEDERVKEVGKKKKWLEQTKVRNVGGMSKRWKRWAGRVSALQMKIANQRADVLHKISRSLAEGCDMVGIGHWEPEREVSFRKKLREARKKVKNGVAGAADELKALQDEKSKQGPKGAKKRRRGGRDRSIATLRRLVDEKAIRASITAFTDINEAYSTMTCCVCGERTGPKKDLSAVVTKSVYS